MILDGLLASFVLANVLKPDNIMYELLIGIMNGSFYVPLLLLKHIFSYWFIRHFIVFSE